jgi:hypothetical protein
MKASSVVATAGPEPIWLDRHAVALHTGLKSWPLAWSHPGDVVKVDGLRGQWKISSISQRVGTEEINVEVVKAGHSRIFRHYLLTAVKCLEANMTIAKGK